MRGEEAWRTAARASGLMRPRPLASLLSDPPSDPLHRPFRSGLPCSNPKQLARLKLFKLASRYLAPSPPTLFTHRSVEFARAVLFAPPFCFLFEH